MTRSKVISVDDEEVLIKCTIIWVGEKALRTHDIDGDEVYLPLQFVERVSRNEILIPLWLAEDKGMI